MNLISQFDFRNLLAGVLLGAVVSWVISDHFYAKALNDAKADG